MYIRLTRGVRPRLEGKEKTPLSSRVATGMSWSPLSDQNGVKPTVEFGERTRDCSPGRARKEGRHVAKTGASRGFSLSAASVGFLTRYDGELREPLVWCQGSQGFMSVAEGVRHCPRVMVGESGLKAC